MLITDSPQLRSNSPAKPYLARVFYFPEMKPILTEDDIPRITELLESGMTDAEIGRTLGGFTKSGVQSFRRRYEIDALRAPGRQLGQRIEKEDPHPLEQIIENGIRITLCPKAYAHGIVPQRNVGCREE